MFLGLSVTGTCVWSGMVEQGQQAYQLAVAVDEAHCFGNVVQPHGNILLPACRLVVFSCLLAEACRLTGRQHLI